MKTALIVGMLLLSSTVAFARGYQGNCKQVCFDNGYGMQYCQWQCW